jgi:hypothetical protein
MQQFPLVLGNNTRIADSKKAPSGGSEATLSAVLGWLTAVFFEKAD